MPPLQPFPSGSSTRCHVLLGLQGCALYCILQDMEYSTTACTQQVGREPSNTCQSDPQ